LNKCTTHRAGSAFEHQRLPGRLLGTERISIRTVEREMEKILEMPTCCDSSVSDVSGVIPQAESSTTTLEVGMAWVDRSEAQVRMRERIKELRCILGV